MAIYIYIGQVLLQNGNSTMAEPYLTECENTTYKYAITIAIKKLLFLLFHYE